MKILSVAVVLLALAASAGTQTYYLTDPAGGSVTSSAIWKDGSVPPASSSSDTLNIFAQESAKSAATRLEFPEETPYVWDVLGFGYTLGGAQWTWNSVSEWRIEGGQLTLKSGFEFRARGTLKVASELATTAADGLTVNGGTVQLLGPRTVAAAFAAVNGDLALGSDDEADGSSGDVLAAGTVLRADGTGKILVRQDATAATLAGSNDMAVVDIPEGKTLTLAGLAGVTNATTYAGDLTGSGTLVKGGADYTLTLTGASWTNRTFNGTVCVDAGVLELSGEEAAPTAPDGLLCYYNFDDPLTPGANIGTLNASATYNVLPVWSFSRATLTGGEPLASDNLLAAGGIRGRCAQMDGKRILAGDSSNSLPMENKPFAVVAWFKSGTATGGCLFRWGKAATYARVHAAVLKKGIAFARNNSSVTGTGCAKVLTDRSFNDNQWHMLVCMFNGGTAKTDLNGSVSVDGGAFVEVHVGEKTTSDQSGTLVVGGDYTTEYLPSKLAVDEFAVYSRILTQGEVIALYEAKRAAIFTAAAEEKLPRAVAHWTFDDENNVGRDSGLFACHLIRGATTGSSHYPTTLPNSPFGGRYGCSSSSRGDMSASYLYGNDNTTTYLPTGDSSATVSFWYSAAGTAFSNNERRYPAFWWGAKSPATFQLIGGAHTGLGTVVGCLGSSKTECQDVIGIPNEDEDTGWHHVSMTYDSSTKVATWYLDARQISTATLPDGANFSGGTNLIFGAEPAIVGDTNTYWNGFAHCYDEFKIYDCALTADQVARDRRATMPRGGPVLSTNVNVRVDASGTIGFTQGGRRTFSSFACAGNLMLGDGTTLAFDDGEEHDIDGHIVTGMRYSDAGTIEVSGGSWVTLSGTCDFTPETELVVANGTLTISGTANACQVRVREGGTFAGLESSADVVMEDGAVLSPTSPLATSGQVTIPDAVTIDARGWDGTMKMLLKGGTVLGSLPTQVSYLEGSVSCKNAILVLKDKTLWLVEKEGMVILFR